MGWATATGEEVNSHLSGNFYYQLGEESLHRVLPDLKEAFNMFQIAADNHKHPRAQYQVGEMLMHGRGTFQDPIQAFRYFKAAADQGLVEAAFQTGVMFHKGKVVDQDLLQATHYLQKATSANYKPALRYMRQVYKRGGMRTRDALLFEDVSKPTLMKTIGRKLSKLQRVMQMGCMKSEIDEISTH